MDCRTWICCERPLKETGHRTDELKSPTNSKIKHQAQWSYITRS